MSFALACALSASAFLLPIAPSPVPSSGASVCVRSRFLDCVRMQEGEELPELEMTEGEDPIEMEGPAEAEVPDENVMEEEEIALATATEQPFGEQPFVASDTATSWGITNVSPDGRLVQRVEGKTRKTWKFNDYSQDRVHVALASEGRPMNADIQLWLGPDWTPFTLKAYSEDGKARPIQTVVGTRNKAATIEVRNVGEYEFPFSAASNYAQGAMATIPVDIPATTDGTQVDGGALRSFPIDPMTEQLEVVLKTDGRQLNARIELLNAPNNPKQTYEVFTNNGELNSLCLGFNTPDPGSTIRIVNLAPVEFPAYIYIKEN